MQFKNLLTTGSIARCFYRNYVSIVNVNVNSLASIKIKPQDYLEQSNDEVKFKVFDDSNKEVDAGQVKSLEVQSDRKEFKLNCAEGNKFSLLLELPLASSPEIQLQISARETNVHVGNLQTKSIDISVKTGSVSLKNLKSNSITAEVERGSITTKSLLLGKVIKLMSKDGNVNIEKSQGDSLEVEAPSITVESCYSTNNRFTSTRDATLKNLHANSTIKSSGDTFKLSGFSGSLQAKLNNQDIEIQLSELYGANKIKSTNPNAKIKLGLSEAIVNDINFKISSNCTIHNSIKELLVCHKEKSFEIKKEYANIECHLHVDVENGESVELTKMSWIDALKLKK